MVSEEKLDEAWLDRLRGSNDVGEKPDGASYAKELRESILDQQQRAEKNIDEIAVKRVRKKMLAEVDGIETESRQGSKKRDYRIWTGIAAAALILAITAPLFLQDSGIPDLSTNGIPTIIRSFGDLEIPRGAIPTFSESTESPAEDAHAFANVLEQHAVPYELVDSGTGVLIFTFVLDDSHTDQRLVSALREFGIPQGSSGISIVKITKE